MSKHVLQTITIADGESVSSSFMFGGGEAIGLQFPASTEGTACTFQVSSDNSTFVNLYDDFGTEVTITMASSRAVALTGIFGAILPWAYIKVRTGTSGTPQAQTGACVITVNTKG